MSGSERDFRTLRELKPKPQSKPGFEPGHRSERQGRKPLGQLERPKYINQLRLCIQNSGFLSKFV